MEGVLEDRRFVDRRILEIDPMQSSFRGIAQTIGREFVLALDVSADAPEVGQQVVSLRPAFRAGPAPPPAWRWVRGRGSTTRSRAPRSGRSGSRTDRRRARRTP